MSLCSEEFRTAFKKENPNVKAVSAVSVSGHFYMIYFLCSSFSNVCIVPWFCVLKSKVGKAGGEKWKSITEAVSAPMTCNFRPEQSIVEVPDWLEQ